MSKAIFIIVLLLSYNTYSQYETIEEVKNNQNKEVLYFKSYSDCDSSYCEKGKENAIKDIKLNKIKLYQYSNFSDESNHKYRASKELKKLLKQHNIEYWLSPIGCLPDCIDLTEKCYNAEIDKFIKKNYGEEFIEKLTIKANEKFDSNKPKIK